MEGGKTHHLASQHLLYMKGVAEPLHFLEWEQYVWPFRQEGDGWAESEGGMCVTMETPKVLIDSLAGMSFGG